VLRHNPAPSADAIRPATALPLKYLPKSATGIFPSDPSVLGYAASGIGTGCVHPIDPIIAYKYAI
jgi:hypothetical protein